MPTFTFNPSHWSNPNDALRREWIVTNGLGGWASGTIGGANTRRYHGALVAALRPPVDRRVLVNKLDDWVTVNGVRYGLSANEFADGTIDPRGWEHLEEFALNDGLPEWTYRLAGATLIKHVFMPLGHNAAWTLYSYIDATAPLTLEITPLLNHRDFHSQTRAGDWRPKIDPVAGGARIELFPGAHPIWILYPGGQFEIEPVWIRDLFYRIEQGRGLPEREDALRIGTITAILTPGNTFAVLVSAEEPTPEAYHWRADLDSAADRHYAVLAQSRLLMESPDWVQQLVLAADQFIVLRTDGNAPIIDQWRKPEPITESNRTVIAGYHWFSDWGRDTMIALPGLCLSTGRYVEAASILRTFAKHTSQGMLPNRFPDSGETPEYNTADATLWYFHAIERYLHATGDEALARELFPALEDIIGWHIKGTRYNIHCDKDGLLYAGAPGVQLTWMDAKVRDWVVTPRIGKPVEINALWINALRVMYTLYKRFQVTPRHDYRALANNALMSFSRFWYEEGGYLYDVIDDPQAGNVALLRPNQLFAVSLPYAPLELKSDRARAVVDSCLRDLVTPFGLRSLAPNSPDFKPKFRGGPLERDGAYHQGTVWGWLLGPFVEAHYKVYGDKQKALSFLEPLAGALTEYGIGTLAEVYDATKPFTPGGCMAQAWSVSEVLRVWRMVEGE
ncbi:MAG TPA: amylo-alpha-1,6-glucosidase [Anaerolineales bacterium]|nr:amylo-alpha-1,6-glucosidase [Anaerolineales bacterium]